MKNLKIFLAILITSILLSGCLKVRTLINVNQDGTGTIEETVLMKSEFVNMMKEFADQMNTDGSKKDFSLFNKDELAKKSSDYGKGVSFQSGKLIREKNFEGFTSVYSFKDINQLKLNPDPEGKMDFGFGSDEEKPAPETNSLLTFKFSKDNPSNLVVKFPKSFMEDDSSGENSDTEETAPSGNDAKMKEFLADMEMDLSINFNGEIKETNASLVEGSKVTLIHFEFGELLNNEAALKKLGSKKPKSIEEFKELTKDIKGMKIEFNDEIFIKF